MKLDPIRWITFALQNPQLSTLKETSVKVFLSLSIGVAMLNILLSPMARLPISMSWEGRFVSKQAFILVPRPNAEAM
jgi:hypothetical protein